MRISEIINESREENFKRWFGRSRVVDGSGQPLKVYHGSNASFDVFSLNHRGEGKGVDQYGVGFYFAEDPDLASSYAGGDGANVLPVYLNITKPLTITTPELRRAVVEKLIRSAPNYKETLSNFGDMDYEGERAVLSSAIDAYSGYDDALSQLGTIGRDFWGGQPEAFARIIQQATGYDGVVVEFSTGRVWVAFRSEQVKSATGNNGAFDPTNPDITKENYEDR